MIVVYQTNTKEIQWISIMILIKDNHVCEMDWKIELEDFIFNIKNLQGFILNELPFQSDWLSEK